MNEQTLLPNRFERVAYALLGLLAGAGLLFIFLLSNAIRAAAFLAATRVGRPVSQIIASIEVFVFYAACSLVGWLIVGLPTALLFPPRVFVRLPVVVRVAIGVMLGPLALFLIMAMLAHGHIASREAFTGTEMLWVYAAAVSVTAFLTYIRLLQTPLRNQS